MSTRSQLRFVERGEYHNGESYERAAQVYRHSDGYPSAVIPDLRQLRELLAETGAQRDPSYTAANFIFLQKLRGMGLYMEEGYGDVGADGLAAIPQENDVSALTELDQPHFLLGYGVENVGDIHGDEEYLYIVETQRDPDEEWTVTISEHNGFGRFTDQDEDHGDRFEDMDVQYEGPLSDVPEELLG